ncbi:retention module-containing protein [Chitinimonas sp. BJB300]|uniref:retention module-containing protein n=1 Tax=Chitinimonas sp. BJB300 TaxID=1559339 RepID=UPI001182C636|nr:retention module-containing protein [Chitinimonas sp. BJB300]TSJ90945.1 retention module-containing protein [Chitinimonas sp. BJB300]
MAADQVHAQARCVVVQLQGQAWAIDGKGDQRQLKVGEAVQEGEQIITAAGALLELGLPEGQSLHVAAERTLLIDANLLGQAPVDASEAALSELRADVDKIIQALNEGRDISLEVDPTAAGLAGGEGNDAHGFVRLLRLSEGSSTATLPPISPRVGAAMVISELAEVAPARFVTELKAYDDTATVSEDSQININVMGNDSSTGGSVMIIAGQPIAANGTVTVNNDGTLRYTPARHFVGTDTIHYTIADNLGHTSTATVRITVTPVNTNTAPVTNHSQVATTEDQPVSGKVVATDVDGNALTYSKGSDPDHGTVTVDRDGNWTYTPALDYHGTDSFTVTVSDGQGGTTTATIDINVTPVDDLPVISHGSGSVIENIQLSATGNLTATDVDNPSLAFVAANSTGQYGSLTIDAAGKWAYVLDNRAELLGEGEVRHEAFTISLSDGNTSSITITITGTNDGAVIGAGVGDKNTGSVTEDTTLVSSGKLTVTDADSGQGELKPANITNAYGTFTVDKTGNWNFTLNNAATEVQSLTAGQTVTQIFAVESLDGTPSSVTITINGTNDGAVIGAGAGDKNTGSVTEDTTLVSSGKLTVTDADQGQAELKPASITNAYGIFTVDKTGNWNFTLNNTATEVQLLAAGQTVTQTFAVESLDGTPSSVTITINGTNDGAVIGAGVGDKNTGSVTEDTTLVSSGKLTVTDADQGQAELKPASITNAYGTFTVDKTGNWNFTLNNAATEVQRLTAGQTVTQTFAVESLDGTPSSVTITINGTNDGAVIGAGVGDKNTGSVTEDTTLVSSGKLTVSDVDSGQAELKPASITNAYGTFTVDKTGNWQFTLNNAAIEVQSLAGGQTVTQTFAVESLDGTPSSVTVVIVGTAESATVGSGVVQEDTTLTSTGTLLATGGAAFVAETLAGTYGSLNIAPNGQWTYSLANTSTVVQSLSGLDSKVEVFSVTLLDGTTTTVTINVAGLNDDAVITGKAAGAVTEDIAVNGTGQLTDSGTLSISDADAGQSSFQTTSVTASAGALGSLNITSSGSWTYNVANSAVQYLKAGEAKQETFTVLTADGTPHQIVVTITGTNDKPVIGGSASGNVVEAGGISNASAGTATASGTLTINDSDSGQNTFQTPSSLNGSYGTFTFNGSAGAWTYALDNNKAATQGLTQGQVVHDTLTVTSLDGSATQVIDVTVTGSNDNASIHGVTTGDVLEDGALSTSGVLAVSDVDNGEAVFQTPTSLAGTYGTFTFNPLTGEWSYTADNSKIQFLGDKQQVTDTLVVHSLDGTATQDIVVTITGMNDGAVIGKGVGDQVAGAVIEDSVLMSSGKLTVVDADQGEAALKPRTEVDTYGTFSVNKDGNWQFVLNNTAKAVQDLVEGQSITKIFMVESVDGTQSSVEITITGTNDVPVIIGDAVGAVTEDAASPTLTDSGTLTVNDADAGQSSFQTTSVTASAGALGSLNITSSGSWTYNVANSAVQYLKAGEAKQETFTVLTADGTPHQIVVTITGTNDKPVIGGSASGNVVEAGGISNASAGTATASGTLTINDSDSGQNTFQTPSSLNGSYGTFTFNGSAGAWTYALDNNKAATQGLTQGQVVHDTLTVTSLDGSATQVIDVTVTGSNDNASIHGVTTGDVLEDGALSTSGVLAVSDVDNGEAVFQTPTSLAGTYGTFTFNPLTGEWSYTADNSKIQFLGDKQQVTDTLVVHSLDGTATQDIVVTITGMNDGAVIGKGVGDQVAGAVIEDSVLMSSGKLTVVDADQGEAALKPRTEVDTYGTFSVNKDGNWQFVLNNTAKAVQDLVEGQSITKIFMVESVDGTQSSVEITITGTNDVPVIIGDAVGAVTEDAASPTLTDSGTLTVNDADAGQSSFQTTSVTASAGALGSLNITSSGSWTYNVANSAVQYLKAGETKQEVFTVLSADGTPHQVVVTIMGTNDVPTIAGSASGNVVEAGGVGNASTGTATTSGTLTISDSDNGQNTFQTPSSLNGSYGTFTFNSGTGAWTYALDNSKAATQGLTQGQVVHDTLTVTSLDGSATRVIDVTVTGSNDHASISGTDTGGITEDGQLSAKGKLTVVDVDNGEDVFQPPTSLAGTYGSFTFNATTGDWGYTADNRAIQSLGSTNTVTETLTVRSIDGTASQAIEVKIQGMNDAPTGADKSVTILEDSRQTFTAADFGFSDVDAGDSLRAVKIIAVPMVGRLQLGGALVAAGQVIVASDLARLVFIPADNGNGNDYAKFTFSVQDQSKAFDTVPNAISIHVTPVNDTPTGADKSVTILEDGSRTFAARDFGFQDVDAGDSLKAVRIDTLPAAGSLTLDGMAVTAGQVIAAAELDKLVFTPASNGNGNDYASFTFSVQDQANAFDTVPNTISIHVTPVNDAPTGADKSVTILEDGSRTFAARDFGFQDVDAGDSLKAVRIDSLPTAGVLTLNNVSVTAGQVIAVAQLGNLVFTPVANGNGNDYASFTFSVQDQANAFDPVPNTISIHVTPVNDAPTGADKSVTILEDGSRTFAARDFGFQDVDAGDSLKAVRIDSLPTAGVLTLNNVSVTAGQVIAVAQLGNLVFTPAANGNGNDYASFTFSVQDQANAFDTLPNKISIDVTAVNDAPTGADKSVTILEDGSKAFTAADFGFSDVDAGDSLKAVRIDALPIAGVLTLNGVAVTSKQVIAAAELDKLVFTPAANGNGNDYASLTFSVQDQANAFDTLPNKISIDVTAVNDAPTGADKSVTILEDGSKAFTAADFGFSDVDAGDSLKAVRIDALPIAGVLTLNGVAVTSKQVIAAAELDKLVFTPAANGNGNDYASLTFSVQDQANAFDTLPNKISIDVTAVNDAPTGADKSVTILEDGSKAFTAADFGFSDVDAGDSLKAVRIDALPIAGVLTLNGVAVTSKQVIAAAELDKLVFTPAANGNGNDYASLTFSVQDQANAFDTLPNKISIDVTAVNDAPTGADKSVTILEDGSKAFTAADFGFSDVDAGDSLKAVRIDALPIAGVLTLNGVAVTSKQVIAAAELDKLVFTPAANGNGNDYASFTFSVQDQANAFDPVPQTITINVTAVNDAPTGADKLVVIQEDGSKTFAAGDFGFQDVDAGDSLKAVRIDTLPTAGALTLNNVSVTAGQVIAVAQLGNLVFTPAANGNGSNYANFTFSVQDQANAYDTVPNKISIDVTAVNDAPTAGGGMVSGTEDTPLVLSWAHFNVADRDTAAANLLIKVTSVPSDGLLQYSTDGTNWLAVTAGKSLSNTMFDAGRVRFMPDANESGADSFGGSGVGNKQADYARFTYVANDGSVDSASATMRVDIAPVADGASLTGGAVGAGNSGAPPAGNGLTVSQYNSLANVSPADVDTVPEVQRLLDLLNAAQTGTSTISATPKSAVIPADGACRISGLIYLEAGKSYTFSAYQDDTGLLRVGGTEILARPYDSWGNIAGSELRPTVSGYYTIDWAVYNGSGVGAFRPSLSVDGGTAQELNTTNFRLYSSLGQLNTVGGLHNDPVLGADRVGGYYPQVNQGMEDSSIKLGALQYGLIDTDGSETLGALIAKNLLLGTVLTDGTHTFTATTGGTSVDITRWNLATLKLTAPVNFNGTYNLELEGRSTETATGVSKVNTTTIAIGVAGVNDAPEARDDSATVVENSVLYKVQGNLLSNDSDVDGEVLTAKLVNGRSADLSKDIATSYGTIRINADGAYTYTLDKDNARAHALRAGETISDRIKYTITDAAGMTSTAVLTINIKGIDDQVVLWGSNGNDVIRDHYGENDSPSGISNNAFTLNLAGAALGANPAQDRFRFFVPNSADGVQVIDAGAGDDYVEAGEGNDVVYAGSSTDSGHAFIEIRNHALIATDDGEGKLLQNNGSFLFAPAWVPEGSRWANIVNGGGGNDALIGGDGYDLLYGGRDDDYLYGGKGMDGLRGGAGNDRLEGGAGNDVLRGDVGADVFAWTLGDQASSAGATPAGRGNDFGVLPGINLVTGATDLVMDFRKAEGDKLDLRDLLQGEDHLGESAGNLSNYLHFEYSNGRTVVHVSSDGGFANGVYDSSKENQSIVLQSVDLTVNDAGARLLNDNAIIQDLLRNNRLITD